MLLSTGKQRLHLQERYALGHCLRLGLELRREAHRRPVDLELGNVVEFSPLGQPLAPFGK